MDDQTRRWVDRWQALKSPISFGLGAVLLLIEVIKSWRGHPIDGELVIAASGLCGLPLFAPAPGSDEKPS